MKTILSGALIGALMMGTGAAYAQTNLVIGTGSTGGAYYPVGVGIAQVVSDATPALSVDAVTSGGSTDNLRLIGRGEVDMGISNGVVTMQAINGIGPFEGDAQADLRSLFSLYGNTEHHLALRDKVQGDTISAVGTMEGKYNIGARQSGARAAATLMFEALGIDVEALDLEFIGAYDEAARAMQDARISAANLGAGIPVPAITEAYASIGADKLVILGYSDEELAMLNEKYPGLYYKAIIPAGSYPGLDADVQTAEYANLMLTSADVDETAVYEFVKATFENIDKVQAVHPAAKTITLENALNGLSAPLHPGALKYYEEKGIAIPDNLRP